MATLPDNYVPITAGTSAEFVKIYIEWEFLISQLFVWQQNDVTGVIKKESLGDFTIVEGDDGGGVFILVSNPDFEEDDPAVTVYVFRQTPNTQEYNAAEGQRINPEGLTDGLNHVTKQVQENEQNRFAGLDPTLRPITSVNPFEIPDSVTREDTVMGFDDGGDLELLSLLQRTTDLLSALPAVSTAADTDSLQVWDSGSASKITVAQLRVLMQAAVSGIITLIDEDTTFVDKLDPTKAYQWDIGRNISTLSQWWLAPPDRNLDLKLFFAEAVNGLGIGAAPVTPNSIRAIGEAYIHGKLTVGEAGVTPMAILQMNTLGSLGQIQMLASDIFNATKVFVAPNILSTNADDIAANDAHRTGDGSDHADVATNNAKVSFPEAPIDGTYYTRKDGAWVASPAAVGIYRDVWIPAAAMTPDPTAGPTAVTEQYTAAAGRATYDGFDFDPSITQFLNFTWAPPDEMDDTQDILVKAFWTTGAVAGTGNVQWGFAVGEIGDNETLNQLVALSSLVVDSFQTDDALHIAPKAAFTWTSGQTAIANMGLFSIARNAAGGSDTYDQNARLLGVKIQYKEKTTTPVVWS